MENKILFLDYDGVLFDTLREVYIVNRYLYLNEDFACPIDEENYELTIRIPHAALHSTSYDPEKTEIGDLQKGWLAVGDIKLTVEQQKEFEVEAKRKLEEKLSEKDCFDDADRFAKVAAYELYQPIVRTVSPAYKVVIDFQ